MGGKPTKWMVKIRETPIKMDHLGGKPPLFLETPICPKKNPCSKFQPNFIRQLGPADFSRTSNLPPYCFIGRKHYHLHICNRKMAKNVGVNMGSYTARFLLLDCVLQNFDAKEILEHFVSSKLNPLLDWA